MRLPTMILGFSIGAFLMWKVAVPVADASVACDGGRACTSPDTVAAAAPLEDRGQGLRIVVYDPHSQAEPLGETAPAALDWVSPDAPPANALPAPASPNGRGACAVVLGRELGCLAFVNLGYHNGNRVSGG